MTDMSLWEIEKLRFMWWAHHWYIPAALFAVSGIRMWWKLKH